MDVRTLLQVVFLLIFFAGSTLAKENLPCSDGLDIYIDESANDCLQYITNEALEGLNQTNALKLAPNRWRNPTLKLNCSGRTRRDFSEFSVLEFYFRSPNPDPGAPLLYLETWDHKSCVVSIRDYISGGIIDNTFRLVRIPLSVLATSQWDLGNVERLVWSNDPDSRTYYVDNIRLRQTEPLALVTDGLGAPFPETDTVLRLTFTKRYREETVRNVKNYYLISLTDPSYSDPVHPIDAGLEYRVERFSSSGIPAVRFSVFVKFPYPLKNGCSYRLMAGGVSDIFCNIMKPAEVEFNYDDASLLNENIKVNQVGYLPDAPKVGYVGGYSGDLGGTTWAVGDDGAVISLKARTQPKRLESNVKSALRGVSGIREDSIYCVGDRGVILNWNGTNFDRIDPLTDEDLLAVDFGPTGIGWAVGKGGITLRCQNGHWTRIPSPIKTTLRGVWAGPGDSAWAVGDRGTILGWDGKSWISENNPVRSDLHAVHGFDTDQIWAVGKSGVVLLRKSKHWSQVTGFPQTSANLLSVITDNGGGVWIGGDQGLVWSKPGPSASGFVAHNTGITGPIYGLTREDSRSLFALGSNGQLLSFVSPTGGWKETMLPEIRKLRAIFSIPYGALRLPSHPPIVTLRDMKTKNVVMLVPLKMEAANWYLSGEDVYSFDFSALTVAGDYYAHVPGLGISYPVHINDHALDNAAYTAGRAFYYQRCGTPLTEPYAEKRFTRPICHEFDPNGRRIDATFLESLSKTPLYFGENPGKMKDGQGGWHDAGDYGKYVPTSAAALWYLFTAYDMDPGKFPDGTWNIPESGNGVPDILDEAKWELDWILKMQESDGGVYHKLTSQSWFQGMPQADIGPRYFFERTTHETASAAAVLACASRLWKPYNEKLSMVYLQGATKAWDFLKQHPHPVPTNGFHNPVGNATGEYRDPEDVDNRLWAAAELYRTTGESQFKEFFELWWKNNSVHPWGWNAWQQFYRCAYWAYVRSPWPNGDSEIRYQISRELISSADNTVALTYSNPYRNGAKLNVPEWIGWGCFTQSSEYAFRLLQAWNITKDKRYRDSALLNLDAQLGANPLSMSFITGLGKRYPQDPLHLPSLYDGVTEPIPGLPVFGVAAHLPNNQPFYIASQEDKNSFPHSLNTLDPYPILRRYIDAHELVPMSEFTIVDIAVCASVFHLLAEGPK